MSLRTFFLFTMQLSESVVCAWILQVNGFEDKVAISSSVRAHGNVFCLLWNLHWSWSRAECVLEHIPYDIDVVHCPTQRVVSNLLHTMALTQQLVVSVLLTITWSDLTVQVFTSWSTTCWQKSMTHPTFSDNLLWRWHAKWLLTLENHYFLWHSKIMFALPCNLYTLSVTLFCCMWKLLLCSYIYIRTAVICRYICAVVADLPVAGVAADVAFPRLFNIGWMHKSKGLVPSSWHTLAGTESFEAQVRNLADASQEDELEGVHLLSEVFDKTH